MQTSEKNSKSAFSNYVRLFVHGCLHATNTRMLTGGTPVTPVRDGAAYIGIISLKYGQVPPCPRRNPDDRSITELEFNEEVNKGTFYFTDKYKVPFSNVQSVSPEIRDIVRTTSGLGVTSFLCKLRFRKSRHPRSRSSGYAISRRTQCTIDVR